VDKGILPNVYEAIEVLFSRTQQLADAISNVKAAQQDYGGAEPSIHNLPCPYIFFPVRVSSVVTGSGFWGTIQKPTGAAGYAPWTDDTDLDPVFVSVKDISNLPVEEEIVHADFIGNHDTDPYVNYGMLTPSQIRYGTLKYDTTSSPCDVTVGDTEISAVLRKVPTPGTKYAEGTGVYLGRTPTGWEVISILECTVPVV